MNYEDSITAPKKALPSRNEIRDSMLSSQIRLIHQHNKPSNRKPYAIPSVYEDVDQESTIDSRFAILKYEYNNSLSYNQGIDLSIDESTIQSERYRFNMTNLSELKTSQTSLDQKLPELTFYDRSKVPPKCDNNNKSVKKCKLVRSSASLADYHKQSINAFESPSHTKNNSDSYNIQNANSNDEVEQHVSVSRGNFKEEANCFDKDSFAPKPHIYLAKSNRLSKSLSNLYDSVNFSNNSMLSVASKEELERQTSIIFELDMSHLDLELDSKKYASNMDLNVDKENSNLHKNEMLKLKGKFKKKFKNILHYRFSK